MIKKIIVSEEFSHFIPSSLGWVEGLEKLGHEVFILPQPTYTLSDIDEEADLVIYFDVRDDEKSIDEFKRFKDRYPNCKIVGMGLLPKPNYYKYKGLIDFWVNMTIEHKESIRLFNEIGFEIYSIPLAGSDTLFYPLHPQKIYDVSFIGQFGSKGHGDRDEDKYLYPILDDKSITSFCAGFSYKDIGLQYVKHADLNTIYNQTKVNLNFHYKNQKGETSEGRMDYNGRVWEIALSGNFQLCDHPYIKTNCDNCILVGEKENWKDLVNYYKNNAIEREEWQRKSFEYAKKYHTWEKRMGEFMKLFDK